MPELEVTFKTRAELSGAQQALDATEKQIGKFKGLGKATDELEHKAERLRAAIAASTAAMEAQAAADAKKAKAGQEAASVVATQTSVQQEAQKAIETTVKKQGEEADSTEKLTVKKKFLVDALQSVRNEFPLAAQAIGLVKNPLVFLISVAGLATVAFRNFVQKVDEEERRVEAFQRLSEKVAAFKGATAEMKAQAAAFAQSLAQIGTGAQTAAEKFDALVAAAERVNKLTGEKQNLLKEAELLDVDIAEQKQQITPAQATKRRGEINAKWAAEERRQQALQPLTQAALADQAIAASKKERQGLEEKLPGARDALVKAKTKATLDGGYWDDVASNARDEIKKVDDEIKAKRTAAMDLRAGKGVEGIIAKFAPKGSLAAEGPEGMAKRLEAEAEELASKRAGLEQTIGNSVANKIKIGSEVENADRQVRQLETKIEELTRSAEELKKKSDTWYSDYMKSAPEREKNEAARQQLEKKRTTLEVEKVRKAEDERITAGEKEFIETAKMPEDVSRLKELREKEAKPPINRPAQPKHGRDIVPVRSRLGSDGELTTDQWAQLNSTRGTFYPGGAQGGFDSNAGQVSQSGAKAAQAIKNYGERTVKAMDGITDEVGAVSRRLDNVERKLEQFRSQTRNSNPGH